MRAFFSSIPLACTAFLLGAGAAAAMNIPCSGAEGCSEERRERTDRVGFDQLPDVAALAAVSFRDDAEHAGFDDDDRSDGKGAKGHGRNGARNGKKHDQKEDVDHDDSDRDDDGKRDHEGKQRDDDEDFDEDHDDFDKDRDDFGKDHDDFDRDEDCDEEPVPVPEAGVGLLLAASALGVGLRSGQRRR